MSLLTLSGSDFDIGFAHGRELRERLIVEMQNGLAAHQQALGLAPSACVAQFVERYQPWVAAHLPRVEEEVRGLAEGAELTYGEAFFAAFQGGAYPAAAGEGDCTGFYSGPQTSKNGHTLLGQTKDTPTSPSRYVPMKLEYAAGPHALILNYPGWAANLGMNSYGIGFTGNSRYTRREPGRGLPLSFLKKAILNAQSLRAIRELIQRFQWQNGALLIAAAGEGAFCVEFIHGETYFTPAGEGTFAHSNTILASQAQGEEDAPAQSPSSESRMVAARAFLAANGPHDRESLRKLSQDHAGSPFSICLHPNEAYPLSTTAAMVVNLSTGDFDVVIGQPCAHRWASYHLPMARS